MNRYFFLFYFFLCLQPIVFARANQSESSGQAGTSVRKSVNPEPSSEVNAVLRYLQDIYGEKTLSGQMCVPWGIDELDYLKETTGKYPAIRGIDFIHERSNETEIYNAIKWWKSGGIPTIMWHWGAPSIGEGYENSKREIDIKQCFIQGTPEYTAFWEELKLKADHLEKLRDANVPVIWRPFHECNGTWFWWSKQGPEPFKQLWITMFNYFVNERKLNNLIWFLGYTSKPDMQWYPGEEYVDLLGADTYEGGAAPHTEMFTMAQIITGSESVPVAYHECGTIPDPDQCKETETMWSWWMQWHTKHLTDMDKLYLANVYNHKNIVTLDELPNIMEVYGKETVERTIIAGKYIPLTQLKSFYLGTRSVKGTISGTDNLVSISSAGNDFTGKKDEGYFAFNQIEGDFDISVKVNSFNAANTYSKAGIMARVDLGKNSQHVFFHVYPDNSAKNKNFGGCEFQYRKEKGADSETIFPDLNDTSILKVDFPNTWIRLTRKGNFFRTYFSNDNKNWHLYSVHKQSMPEKLLVGVAITSRDAKQNSTVQFSELQQVW